VKDRSNGPTVGAQLKEAQPHRHSRNHVIYSYLKKKKKKKDT